MTTHRTALGVLVGLAILVATGMVAGAGAADAAPDPLVVANGGSTTYGGYGDAYASAVVAHGGTPPYSFAVTVGALPPGVVLDASTGALTGAPTAMGTFAFTVEVTDHGAPPQTATGDFTVQVGQGTSWLTPGPALIGLRPLALALTSVRATLTGGSAHVPLPGRTVTFGIGDHEVCTATTDAAGVASCPIDLGDDVQILLHNGFTCWWAGDDLYLPSAGDARLLAPPTPL
jgi:hypothetical protein